ncbi:MAG TPA: hypothetical protein VF171_07680 [Trueperaceae bacterium]
MATHPEQPQPPSSPLRHARARKRATRRARPAEALALGQGLYYLTTGCWPLLHMPSFERVTGPKTDRWLVRTVGLLLGVVGTSLAAAGLRGRLTPELEFLAGTTALSLAIIDIVATAKGSISGVYLLDAAAEGLLAAAWAGAAMMDGRNS